MSNPPWMPLYVRDYLADTTHLRTVEHGAYLLLIMHYWQHGGLPAEDARLCRIVKMRPCHWTEIRPVLEQLFSPGFRSHKRIDHELQHAAAIKEKARQAARKRWSKQPPWNHATASSKHMLYTKKERLTDRETEVGAVDNSGQADQKRSVEEGKDAVAEMRARRMLRKGHP